MTASHTANIVSLIIKRKGLADISAVDWSQIPVAYKNKHVFLTHTSAGQLELVDAGWRQLSSGLYFRLGPALGRAPQNICIFLLRWKVGHKIANPI